MLNAETTDQTADLPAPEANGSCPHHAGASRPTQEDVVEWVVKADAESGLPPGPRMPAGMQMLNLWRRPTSWLESCRARYGNRFTLHIRAPASPFVVLSSPDDIKELFLAPADHLYVGEGSSSIEKYTGQSGLSCLDEDEHLARRRLMNRTMTGEGVARISADVAEMARAEVASWPRDEVITLYPRVHRMTMKVVFHVMFGPAPDKRLDELLDVVIEMMQFNEKPGSVVPTQTLSPRTIRVLKAMRPLGFHRFMKYSARADELIRAVVEDRRRAGVFGEDICSVMLSSTHPDGTPFTWLEIRDEVMTNFVAGTATTAASIVWGIEHLTREPAARERLVAELDAGESDAYLTATVHEILRMRPPLPHIIPRLVMKPTSIGGVLYQPGVHLWGNPWLLHHDPAIYPDPDEFRPERFLGKTPGTYTWIPFGGGRRRCLGRAIADLEMKSTLREVFTNYSLRRDSPRAQDVKSKLVTIAPSRGTRVAVSAR